MGTVTTDGETVTPTGRAIVTDAVLDLVESATDVAVTKTCAGLGTAAGAVYKPLPLIVPHAAPVHPVPATVHVTDVFEELVTVAENCCVAPVIS
jgi:hypothetical protein